MRVFGCAWKINFPENIFNWPCVLMVLTRKLVSVKIFTSNHFWTHAQRERERERGRRESPDHAFDFADLRTHEPIFDPKPSTHRSTNPRTNLQPRAFDPRAFDFAGDPEPSRHEPTNRSLSLCDFDFLCDFDRPMNQSTFLCDFDFLLSLFDL